MRRLKLDPTHPLTKGLIIAFPLNEGSGYPRNHGSIPIIMDADDSHTWGWRGDWYGKCLEFPTGGIGSGIESAASVAIPNTGYGSYLTAFMPYNSASGTCDIFGTGDNFECVYKDATDVNDSDIWVTGNNQSIAPVGTAGGTAWNRIIQMAATCSDVDGTNGNVRIFSGEFGERYISPQYRRNYTGLRLAPTLSKFRLGTSNNLDTVNGLQGRLYYVYLWDRQLSDEEMLSMMNDPYQIFIDTSRPIIGAHQLPTHVDYGMVKVPWTKQPPPGTPLDLDNPLTRGLDLVDAMDDPKGQDVSGNYPRSLENDAIPRVSRQPGRGQYWDVNAGVDSVRRGYSVGNDFSGIPEITVASLHRIVSAQANAHFFAKKDKSGFLSWELYKTGTGGSANKYWLFVNTSGGTYGNDAGAALVDDYDPHLVVGVFKTDSHLQVWLDGALYASDADTPTGNITTRSWAVTFAGEDDGAGGINQSQQDEEMFLNCVWSRALSEAEIKAFSANPWQIFKPREIMVPINENLPELGTFEKPWDDMPL